ncbi:unnamed protein product, partial [Brenthis ino]
MDLKKNQKEQWNEVNKNECGVLKQMATFQPNAPLKVTLILEKSDAEDYLMPIEDYVKTKERNSKITCETIYGSQIFPSGNFSDSTEIPSYEKTTYLNSQNFTMDNNRIVHNTNELASNVNYQTIERKKITTLLDTLSKNLIRVISLGYDTYNNYKNDRLMFEKAKNNYLQFKNNIFEVSYVITESIILPQENNYFFIEKFINRTLEIANNVIANNHDVSRELLLNIIADLINWTKQKKKVLETSKTLSKLDHNSLTSTHTTMNIAPISSLQLNNINCMYSNHTREENMHTTNGHSLNNIQGIINGPSLKRNSSVNIPEEENTILASKRQKLTYDKRYCLNIPQASIQNYAIGNELRENVSVNDNNNLNIDVQLSAPRSVSRDSGIGSPIRTNWPTDQMGCTYKARVTTIAKDAGMSICKATANQICLANCSSQRNDWNAHMPNYER